MTTASKITVGLAGALLLGSQFYGDWSARSTAENRAEELARQIQSTHDADKARIAELNTELESVRDRLGVAAADSESAMKKLAASTRQEQTRVAADLRSKMAEHAKAVDNWREESGQKLEEVRLETTSQIVAVNGEVGNVKTDLDDTRKDLAASRREIGDVRDSLGRQIAHNADELSVLKRRGERKYYEFDIQKAKDLERIAGIRMQLNKADAKTRRFDVTLQVDDNKLLKKGLLINEPVQFMVGREHLRYELVVNAVYKDRIQGYLSTPTEGNGEGPLALK